MSRGRVEPFLGEVGTFLEAGPGLDFDAIVLVAVVVTIPRFQTSEKRKRKAETKERGKRQLRISKVVAWNLETLLSFFPIVLGQE